VKDLFDTEGVRTTYGSAVFSDHVPSRTAEAVELLEAAGYTNVGKANLHEFAYGTTSQNVHYGTVPNPAARGRIAGGSSGGSAAALAAGLAEAALGTDSGGSIRIPSACCGTTGLKPTFGLVSTDGVFPLAPSFDHSGPMALDVDGCTAMMAALVPGFAAEEVALGDVRAGVAWLDAADPLVRARVGEAAALLSAEPMELPFGKEIEPLFMREVGDVHRELYPEHAELYGENISSKIERCIAVSDGEAAAAEAAREAYRERMTEAFEPFDVVLTPTLSCVAPRVDVDEIATRDRLIRLTFPFNALGWPALALPCGAAEDGLPASVQLVGLPGTDPFILGLGKAVERRLKS
jgi:aspartyl-tRNA(Asn)/glutamyl-tRNA(Gln) amidotransferase subunit A